MLKALFGKKRPSQHTVEVRSHDLKFVVPRGRTVLEAAQDAGVGFPYDCKVGTCGTCRYELLGGEIRELNSSAVALTTQELAAGWRLGCQSIPQCDLSIALPGLISEVGPPPSLFEGEIAAVTPLTHDIVELRLRLNRPLTFVAGQFAELEIEAVPGARSYSFANWTAEGTTLEPCFHVRKVPGGAFTEWLFGGERVGTHLMLRAPQGRFRLRKGAGPIVLVGGGSGLAPLKCILEKVAGEDQRPVTLLYGARTQKDLLCVDEIGAIGQRWAGDFRFVPVLSMEAEGTSWSGARGLVSDFLDSVPDIAQAQAYLCGPPPMVDAAEAALLQRGLAPDSIFADRFFDRSRPAPAVARQ